MPESKTRVVVIAPPDHRSLRYLAPLEEVAEISVSVELEELARVLPAAEVVVFGLAYKSLDLAAAWKHAGSVRWAHSLSAGVEDLLFPAMVRSSVPLTNSRGVFKRPLAEFAVLGMLFHYKRVRRLIENQRARQWHDDNVTLLTDRIMGVVGYGEIGRECAVLGAALGMKIHALRRNPERSAGDALLSRDLQAGRAAPHAERPRRAGLRRAADARNAPSDRRSGVRGHEARRPRHQCGAWAGDRRIRPDPRARQPPHRRRRRSTSSSRSRYPAIPRCGAWKTYWSLRIPRTARWIPIGWN